MTDKIKRAIAVLEVNKLISSSQTEFCESVDLAIQALEKQIPKKMIIRSDNGNLRKSCGNCACFVLPVSKYCSKCGWKLDRSDEDE